MLADADSIQSAELPPGYVIAKRYKIDTLIGTGGMGCVYLALDQLLDVSIAVKVLHTEGVREGNVTRQFLRQAKVMRPVKHDNLVRIYDAGIDGTIAYYSMEHVQGVILDDCMHRVGDHPSIT